MPRSPYTDLWHRVVSNTHEPPNEQACWYWSRKLDRKGYGQLNVWVPGMGRLITMKAHIVAFLISHIGVREADELFLAYLEHSASGLELDHLCSCRGCVHPDHLEHVTGSVNCKRRNARARVNP